MERTKLLYLMRDSTVEIWEGAYNNQPVVIKKLQSGIEPESFLQEARVLMKLDHENIIKLQGVVIADEPVYIVLQQAGYETLEDYLTSNFDAVLLQQRIDICKQVALGLHYLQQKLCIHRNIEAETIYYVPNSLTRIGDFKFAVFLDSFADSYIPGNDEISPSDHCAPEVSLRSVYYLKTDIWSYGIFLWQVITGGNFFTTSTDEDGFDMTTNPANDISDLSKPANCPGAYYILMKDCLNEEPSNRPTCDEIKDMLEEIHSESDSENQSFDESEYEYYEDFHHQIN